MAQCAKNSEKRIWTNAEQADRVSSQIVWKTPASKLSNSRHVQNKKTEEKQTTLRRESVVTQENANNAAKSCIWYYWKFQQLFSCSYSRQIAREHLQNRIKLLQKEPWAWFLTQQEIKCVKVDKYNPVLTHRYLIFFSLTLHFVGSTCLFCCPRHRDRHFTRANLKKPAWETETGSKWRKENGPREHADTFHSPLSAHTAQEGLVQCQTPQTGEWPELRQRTASVTGQICGERQVDVEKVEEWWESLLKLMRSLICFTYSFEWDGNKRHVQLQMSRRCNNPHSDTGWYLDH